MTIPPLSLPPGWSTMGAPAPACELSADGSAFYGVQAKFNGAAYVYSVWWQRPGMQAARVDSGTSGQGQLRTSGGGLYATRYVASGDGQAVQVIAFPQYVPFAGADASLLARLAALEARTALAVPASDPLWQLYGGTYTATDMDTPAEVALRVTKQLAALRSIIGLLVRAGMIVKQG